MCAQQTPAQAPALENGNFSSFTYFPNNFLIPLAFFLESGEGGVICRLSISFGRGGKPARSKWSADPFSVSAIRKQKPRQDPLVQDCTDTLLNLGTTLAKIIESHHVKKMGQRGMGKSRRKNMCSSFMGLTGNTPRQCSAPVKCLASKVGKNYLVNQSVSKIPSLLFLRECSYSPFTDRAEAHGCPETIQCHGREPNQESPKHIKNK